MKSNENIICMFAIFVILTASLVSSYSWSNPSYGKYSFISDSSGEFDKKICQAGEDFIIQIAPFGCTPAVVRSDLLEEQNIPVFCQLVATKINPLITVESIDSISFSGKYPPEVQGVDFYPTKSALGIKEKLGFPVLDNIGYAVVLLKKQKNASAMPEFVQGALTAKVKYDIKNAFGLGKAIFYLPELNDKDWENQKVQSSFWNRQGFLRLESLEDNEATIALYDGESKKISSFDLKKGETSRDISLPTLDSCMAKLQLKLDSLEEPDTRAKLNINGDYFEVKNGEFFLDGKCRVNKEIEKRGLNSFVKFKCDTDTKKGESFNLEISPRVKLIIGGIEGVYQTGDKLFDIEKSEKSVYLGYIGGEDETNEGKSFIIPVISTKTASSEFKESFVYKNLPKVVASSKSDTQSSFYNGVKILASGFFGASTQIVTGDAPLGFYYLGSDNNLEILSNMFEPFVVSSALKNKIIFNGFADAQDVSLSDDIREKYELAIKDYDELILSYSGTKNPEDKQTFGERALFEKIELANKLNQARTVIDLCKEFKGKYPSSEFIKTKRLDYCVDNEKLSSSTISGKDVLINGKTYNLFLEEVVEPKFEEYGATVYIKTPEGNRELKKLKKDQVISLGGTNQRIFSISQGPLSKYISFRYTNGKWSWSFSKLNWIVAPKIDTEKGYNPSEKMISLIKQLEGKNSEEGKQLILSQGGKEQESIEFIQLKKVNENSIVLNVLLYSYLDDVISGERVLDKNTPTGLGSKYVFELNEINLKKSAKVSIIPKIDNQYSQANFTFKIGIEQRSIKLSPEKTKEMVSNLNETIKEWESKSEKLGNVVKTLKGACLVTGGYLTAKNFFTNLGGKSIARQDVMNGKGGINEMCTEAINSKEFNGKTVEYKTVDECIVNEADYIDSSVNARAEEISSENAEYKRLSDGCLSKNTNFVSDIFGERIVNDDCVAEKIINQENLNSLNQKIISCLGNSITLNNVDKNILDITRKITVGKISITTYRDLQSSADACANSNLKPIYTKRLIGLLSDFEVNSENEYVASSVRDDLSKKTGLINVGVQTGLNANFQEKEYTGGKTSTVSCGEIPANVPIEAFVYGGKSYLLQLKNTQKNEFIVENVFDYNCNDLKIDEKKKENLIKEITGGYSFKQYDSSSYQHPFKSVAGEDVQGAVVKFYETEPYKGMPALVPFDTKNGWYAVTRQTLPVFGNIKAYDESGRVTSLVVCNVGENGVAEYFSGINDDKCIVVNTGTGQPYNKFPGLEERKAKEVIDCAVNAIEQASRENSKGISSGAISITTSCGNVKLISGKPAVDSPEMKCTDFMSPKECQILFNVCDPVICPSSRCNLGGSYPVKDVVQSGIIGSIALCLPNFNPDPMKGTVIPICLTGVKAGMDGWISIIKNHRDCLQESLDTGKMVGVCDEIYSVYACEFFWRQGLPLAKIAIPKLMEKLLGQDVRGGGEYLGVANAWDNAGKSMDYFTQYYGANSFKAFKARTTEEAGETICKASASLRYPNGEGLFSALTEPDSPPQFHGRFDEIPFTTATVPPVSQYKVFYHIYAGKDSRAYYEVYLKGGDSSTYYKDTSNKYSVAYGYISTGSYASETKDFTAPSGYKEMCIVVNGQEECGFKQTSTSFAVNYVKDKYMEEQINQKDIQTEKDCIEGTPSAFSLINPNIQEGADETISPSIYNRGIIRICSTDNPGKNVADSRWVEVGYCDNKEMRCWLDKESVDKTIKDLDTKNKTLSDLTDYTIEQLSKTGLNEQQAKEEIEKIKLLDNSNDKINAVNKIIDKVFRDYQRADLFFLRGLSYGELARGVYNKIRPVTGNEIQVEKDVLIKAGYSSPKFILNGEGLSFYYKYSNGKWVWSPNNINWFDITKLQITKEDVDSSWITRVVLVNTLLERYSDLHNALNKGSYSEGLKALIDKANIVKGDLLTDKVAYEQSTNLFNVGGSDALSIANLMFNRTSNTWNLKIKKDIRGGALNLVEKTETIWLPVSEFEKNKNQEPYNSYIAYENLFNSLKNKNFNDGAQIIFDIGNGIRTPDVCYLDPTTGQQKGNCKVETTETAEETIASVEEDARCDEFCKTSGLISGEMLPKEQCTSSSLKLYTKDVDCCCNDLEKETILVTKTCSELGKDECSSQDSCYWYGGWWVFGGDCKERDSKTLLSIDTQKECEFLCSKKNILDCAWDDSQKKCIERETRPKETGMTSDEVLRMTKTMEYYKNAKNAVSDRACYCGDQCSNYAKYIFDSAEKNNIDDPYYLLAIMMKENNCRNYECKDDKSQISCGIMQVNKEYFSSTQNPANIEDNILVAGKVLREQYDLRKGQFPNGCSPDYANDWERAIHGYNGFSCSNLNYLNSIKEIYSALKKTSLSINIPIGTTSSQNKQKVIIDPGHGGIFTGASFNNLREQDINLDFSKKLKTNLENQGYNVFLTRETDNVVNIGEKDFDGDGNVNLRDDLLARADFANKQNSNFFISIHTNDNTDTSINGIEIYVYCSCSNEEINDGKINFCSLQDCKKNLDTKSVKLAEEIEKNMKYGGFNVRFIKGADLRVLSTLNMPGVLIELGYIKNSEDLKLLTSSSAQIKLSEEISGGLSTA